MERKALAESFALARQSRYPYRSRAMVAAGRGRSVNLGKVDFKLVIFCSRGFWQIHNLVICASTFMPAIGSRLPRSPFGALTMSCRAPSSQKSPFPRLHSGCVIV